MYVNLVYTFSSLSQLEVQILSAGRLIVLPVNPEQHRNATIAAGPTCQWGLELVHLSLYPVYLPITDYIMM